METSNMIKRLNENGSIELVLRDGWKVCGLFHSYCISLLSHLCVCYSQAFSKAYIYGSFHLYF